MRNKETIVTLSIILVAAIFELDLKVVQMSQRGYSCGGCGQSFVSPTSLRRHTSSARSPLCGEAGRRARMHDSQILWSPDSRTPAQNLAGVLDQAVETEVFDGRLSLRRST